jgi:hypothetical protein
MALPISNCLLSTITAARNLVNYETKLEIGNRKSEMKKMRPANPHELAGRKLRVGSGITGVAWHRLENRRLWPIPYFKGGCFY